MNKQQKQYPFVDLTNDRAFKAFFSNNEKLLLSLLKAFLPLPDKKTIHSFEFIKDKDTQRQSPQKAYLLGFLAFYQPENLPEFSTGDNKPFITAKRVDCNNRHYYCGFVPIVFFLPKKVQKAMMKVTH